MVSFDRILCPVDLSDAARHALMHAAALAAWYESRLTVLHVTTTLPVADVAPAIGATTMPPITVSEADRDAELRRLREFIAPVVGDLSPGVELADAADARQEILDQASRLQADLLVMGTHGRSGFDHLLLGSVTEKVLRKASCPVLVVPRQAAAPGAAPGAPFRRILCAIDFSQGAERALAFAFDLAQEADARILLLHVLEVPPGLSEFPFAADLEVNRLPAAAEAGFLRRLREMVPGGARDYCEVATSVAEGRAHREILRVAAEEGSDLIVMGVQGRGAVDLALFGSNTYAVIRGASCPVLTVRA